MASTETTTDDFLDYSIPPRSISAVTDQLKDLKAELASWLLLPCQEEAVKEEITILKKTPIFFQR